MTFNFGDTVQLNTGQMARIIGQFRPRAMIADEVGLGKTIEAAMVYEELKLRHQAQRALVIVPASLTRQWQDEFAQKC